MYKIENITTNDIYIPQEGVRDMPKTRIKVIDGVAVPEEYTAEVPAMGAMLHLEPSFNKYHPTEILISNAVYDEIKPHLEGLVASGWIRVTANAKRTDTKSSKE